MLWILLVLWFTSWSIKGPESRPIFMIHTYTLLRTLFFQLHYYSVI